jgi:hypothetical protein
VSHIFGKLLIKATILLQNSPQSEVYTQSYRHAKLQKTQFWEFRDSHLMGISGQNDNWCWPNIENTIRGKVMASPKFRRW